MSSNNEFSSSGSLEASRGMKQVQNTNEDDNVNDQYQLFSVEKAVKTELSNDSVEKAASDDLVKKDVKTEQHANAGPEKSSTTSLKVASELDPEPNQLSDQISGQGSTSGKIESSPSPAMSANASLSKATQCLPLQEPVEVLPSGDVVQSPSFGPSLNQCVRHNVPPTRVTNTKDLIQCLAPIGLTVQHVNNSEVRSPYHLPQFPWEAPATLQMTSPTVLNIETPTENANEVPPPRQTRWATNNYDTQRRMQEFHNWIIRTRNQAQLSAILNSNGPRPLQPQYQSTFNNMGLHGTNFHVTSNYQQGSNLPVTDNYRQGINLPVTHNYQQVSNVQVSGNYHQGSNLPIAGNYQQGNNLSVTRNYEAVESQSRQRRRIEISQCGNPPTSNSTQPVNSPRPATRQLTNSNYDQRWCEAVGLPIDPHMQMFLMKKTQRRE